MFQCVEQRENMSLILNINLPNIVMWSVGLLLSLGVTVVSQTYHKYPHSSFLTTIEFLMHIEIEMVCTMQKLHYLFCIVHLEAFCSNDVSKAE